MNGFLTADEAKRRITAGDFDLRMKQFYGVPETELNHYRLRIVNAISRFTELYGNRPLRVFSVSGRTELGGNHTDHQGGRVLAGGISLDIIAVAAPTDSREIHVKSEGYPEDSVVLNDLEIKPDEAGTSKALLRGTAARFAALGKPVRGFAAYTTSDVLQGSGLSSSAAYEVMLGMICNDFFADSSFSLIELAMIAQYAENVYFGKPCGLMDQMACALGTVTAMDFQNADAPRCDQTALNLAQNGYALCIIDTGADHADLTSEYAAVPREMNAVANMLGAKKLRQTDEAAFWENLPDIRRVCGDRAVLRAMHFYGDNARVEKQTAALRKGDFAQYLALVKESGRSSESYLQNITPTGFAAQQPVAFALSVCAHLLNGKGAYRVHGGGFAGTVQAYVPLDMVAEFRSETERLLGRGACHVLQLRGCGASALWDK